MSLLPLCERSHVSTSMYRHGLKMCMWFGYNPCIHFCYFFHFANFCHFLTSDSMKMLWQWVPCERNSYNFIPIFLKLYTSFCHGLEMCIWFGYNPWINFCHFFHFVNFVIFWPQILWKSTVGTLWAQLLIQFYTDLYETLHMLLACSGDMHMVWYNPWINFCHFFHFVNFVIFWHQILRSV